MHKHEWILRSYWSEILLQEKGKELKYNNTKLNQIALQKK